MKKFTDEARQSQTELGLPAEPVFDWQMSFLPASRTLLLRFSTIGSGIRVPRLFLRREGSNRYVDILDVAEPALASQARAKDREVFLGAQTPVVGSNDVLYFLLWEYWLEGSRRSGNALSVIRVDLLSDSVESRVPTDSSPEECSVIDLLGADREGVFAKAGFKRRVDRQHGSYSVDYFMVHLHWADWVVRRILPLPNIFY